MTFERMADRRPVVTPLIRDDGVAFSLRGAGGGADLPHDLVHLLVETELRVRDAIGRAEALADAAVRLSRGEPVARGEASWVPPTELRRAATALTAARERWRSMRPGQTWELCWTTPSGRS